MAMTMVRRGYRNIMTKDAEDIVILSSLRTPITRAVKGQLSSSYPEQLLHTVLKATLAAVPNLDPALIDDVCVGVVLSELGGSKAGQHDEELCE
ncbi:putative 3-ketoacyl- thiolase B protein [Rutstroemia sp. NJR-2017a BBW]|nr:putative 3-ketoacyl- thiolase B protein [Rutstroemia sp. NJR-2017a BBW]